MKASPKSPVSTTRWCRHGGGKETDVPVITGFASCAGFGSYAFVHPVVRDLPPEQHVRVEKGLLLNTFGRVMPVLMTLCAVLYAL